MAISTSVVPANDISPALAAQMLSLMQRHYDNVEREGFEQDLAAKDHVILLHEASTGRLCGFSTLQVYDYDAGERIRVAFSGDTIIAPEHWGSIQLPLAFGHTLLSELDAQPNVPLYWLLTSKGFRTYRFLPVFFHRFAPHFDQRDVRLNTLLTTVATAQFGDRFDADAGVLRADAAAQRLSAGLIADERAAERKDPHIAYFLARNPGYADGDELVCLAPFERDNLSSFVRRRLVQPGGDRGATDCPIVVEEGFRARGEGIVIPRPARKRSSAARG